MEEAMAQAYWDSFLFCLFLASSFLGPLIIWAVAKNIVANVSAGFSIKRWPTYSLMQLLEFEMDNVHCRISHVGLLRTTVLDTDEGKVANFENRYLKQKIIWIDVANNGNGKAKSKKG